MAGTFVGVSGVQQMQLSGSAPPYGSVPMSGGELSVYSANTSALVDVWQDIGLTLKASNPMTLDATGRVPFFFVADGNYRIRLQDVNGGVSNGGFDLPQVPSIGASTSGGGGSSVDPTTILSTGDVKWQPVQSTLSGFVRMNGKTIGSASSGASEYANILANALFLYAWNNFSDALCSVVGGRGASAAADWNANKQITVLDMRDKTAVGLDGMGNSLKGGLSSVSTSTPDSPGTTGGSDTVALTTAQLPAHNHGVTDPGHAHANVGTTPLLGAGGTPVPDAGSASGSTGSNTTGISIQNTGGNTAHANMPPFMLGTWFWKL